jgi:hypothetical protein
MTSSQTTTAVGVVPAARVAPDAYAQADSRATEAMPGNVHPLGATPGEHLGKVGTRKRPNTRPAIK